ncbi:hypothetical protein EV363DRAFT_49216 [Boletus edulis]|nr:hypothetical protein EV363DRAFT_49216 [Boletus edulis]
MIIFIIMCYSLRRARYLEMAVPDGFLQTVATMLVGRGLTFTIAQMAYFSIFIIAPSKQYWIPLQMVASKLYVNTLNSRHVRQGQGLYEEHSLTDRNVPSDGPFPTSIRLNVTDAKVTIQSINLATQNTARRVMAWGLSRERDRGECVRSSMVFSFALTGRVERVCTCPLAQADTVAGPSVFRSLFRPAYDCCSTHRQTDNHVNKECLSERV